MRLRSLEIKGFKSFAEETVVHFNERVTGIVGPNGSGKSNIIDAIRWVLGEQKTTELRLDAMSSVVFNGTRKRKPAQVAKVSITFDNDKGLLPTEFQNVTISRTLHRSGSSEYRINDVSCRLKDISSLLIDTGIGSDTYAIIALGMVDDILSDKDQARRRMLEQAAGIVKFKNRKRETLLKLKGTREDLNRVEDLLTEIEENLKALEKQAKRTEKYFELKNRYKDLFMQVQSEKYKSHESNVAALSVQVKKETDQYRQTEIHLRTEEAGLEKMKSALLVYEQELSGKQKYLADFIQQLRNFENKKAISTQRIELLEKNKIESVHQINTFSDRLDQIKDRITALEKRLENEQIIKIQMDEELTLAETRLQEKQTFFLNLKASIEEVLQKRRSLEHLVFETEKNIAIQQNTLKARQSELHQILTTAQTSKENLIETQQQLKMNLHELEIAKQRFETLSNAEKERIDKVEKLTSNLKTQERKLSDLKRHHDSALHEYELTRSMIDNLEGFPDSIKFLNKQKQWMQHAILLSDVISCEEKYRISIENYLEQFLNHFIVADRQNALEAVELLSTAQKGKANFLLLSAYQSQPETPKVNGLIRAIDLVGCDPVYTPLISTFLHKVYICPKDKIDSHVHNLLAEVNEGILLSEEGNLKISAASVSGGSVGLFEGKKLGRKKNLEHIEKTLKYLKADILSVEKEQSLLNNELKKLEEADLSNQINVLQKELISKEYLVNQSQDKFNSIENTISGSDQKIEELETVIQDLEKSIIDLNSKLTEQQSELIGFNQQAEESNTISKEMSEELSNHSQTYNQLKIKTLQQHNLMEQLSKELQLLNEQTDTIQSETASHQKRIASITEEIEELTALCLAMEDELVKLLDEKQKNEKDLGVSEQEYFKSKMAVQQVEQSIRQVQQKMLQQQNLINQLKEKFNDARYTLTSIEERCRIEFDIELSSYMAEHVQDTEPEEYDESREEKIERLKTRLANYGEINPMAVEAYNAISKRFDQITEQRNDILDAEQSLLETISEIETTAKEKFLTAFEKIREHFVFVFRSLFTEEDFCDIYMEDPTDPLESPIQIVARPKGKRPQTLQQLSGGEKTLTAIALLFSFYLLKPAPFCIFDEVDAPLDDANIEKFNKIIQKFSKESQFIVVTHNKGTMAAVDIMYGVYMEEMGVSGLSPVDFRQYKHVGMVESFR